jgi:hypothetical protein
MSDFLNETYQIFFSDGTHTEVLEYKIIDSPISRIWLNCIKCHLSSPDCVIYENQSIVNFPSENKIKQLWEKIHSLIKNINFILLNDTSYVGINTNELFFQDKNNYLNYLHNEFHSIHEKYYGLCKELRTYLDQFNKNIHKLQSWNTYKKNDQQSLYATFFLHSSKPRINAIYNIENKDLYSYFNYDDYKFGDLKLGYHTIGKNVFECCWNNDIEVVKKGLVRPQTTISSEVILDFKKNFPSSQLLNYLQTWINDNNLKQYIDMESPENRIVRQPLLGRLQGNYSVEDIDKIFDLGMITKVNLILPN